MLNILSIGLMLYPAMYPVCLLVLWNVAKDNDLLLLCFFAAYMILGIIWSIAFAVACTKSKHSAALVEKKILQAKIAAAPVDILALVLGLIRIAETKATASGGADGVGMSYFVLFLFLAPYVTARICSLLSTAFVCHRLTKANQDRLSGLESLHFLGHLLPIVDVVSAYFLYHCLQNAENQDISP